MKILEKLNSMTNKKKEQIDQFNTLPKSSELNETGLIKIKNLTQYREVLKNGNTGLDFSELDVSFEDIQQLDLENLNLDINIREVFVPFNGSGKIGNNVITPVFNTYTGDYFLKINKSKLGGNNVIGDLYPFVRKGRYVGTVYVWYSEETFDNKYKSQYPQFFLSSDAPVKLKEKYYNPQILTDKVVDSAAVIHDLEDKYREIQILKRQKLTLVEYIKYYEFLKGKYLGNFEIKKLDKQKINLIEKYGLEKAKILLKNIDKIIEDISKFDNFESYIIKEIDENGINLSLRLKHDKE